MTQVPWYGRRFGEVIIQRSFFYVEMKQLPKGDSRPTHTRKSWKIRSRRSTSLVWSGSKTTPLSIQYSNPQPWWGWESPWQNQEYPWLENQDCSAFWFLQLLAARCRWRAPKMTRTASGWSEVNICCFCKKSMFNRSSTA